MKISIVLPCCCAERTLPDILSDISGQTYREWELICVSNGDGQEKQMHILREWERKDSRIRAISLPFPMSGVSQARNSGAAEAKGDWVCFVDADDRLNPNHLELMAAAATGTTDLVYGGITQRRISHIGSTDSKRPLPTGDFVSALLDNDNASAPYNVLIKKNLLGPHPFEPTYTYGEDAVFKYRLISRAQNIALIPLTGYIYVRNCLSVSAVDRYHERIEESIDEKFTLLEQLLLKHGVTPGEAAAKSHRLYYDTAIANILTNPFHIGTPLSPAGKYKRVRRNFFCGRTPQKIFDACHSPAERNPFFLLLRTGRLMRSPMLVTAVLQIVYFFKYAKI